MDVDAAALAVAAAPHAVAAVAAYGRAVLTKAEEAAASGTVQLGGRILRRIFGRQESAPAIEQAVAELAEAPEDQDRVAVLRTEFRRAMQADPRLAAEVADILQSAGISISASGARAVAVNQNSGIVQTGDGSAAWQGSRPLL